MDGDTTERLSQESQCPNAKEHGLLARASAFAGGVLSSIQALAGTTACKGVQIARLKDWAKENDCWIENPESLGVFSDRGSENEVYKRKSIQKDVNCSVFAIRCNSTPLSKTHFTLHKNGINICNLETCTGEELTPLFTTLHPEPLTLKICVNL